MLFKSKPRKLGLGKLAQGTVCKMLAEQELKPHENLRLVFLPPYSPELNPIERLWLHLRDNRLSHCAFRKHPAEAADRRRIICESDGSLQQ